MKKSKGFTLVELLAAIVLLSMLALLTTTAITKNTKNAKSDTYEAQISYIYDAAKEYGTKNTYDIPTATSTNPVVVSYIKLSDLQNDGYLDKKIINQKTKEELTDDDIIIKVTSTYKEDYNKAVTEYEVITDVDEITNAKKTYTITYKNISNSSTLPATAEEGSTFTVTFAEKPETLTVKLNGEEIDNTKYVYSVSTGVFTVTNLSGNLIITASKDDGYDITYHYIKYSSGLSTTVRKNTKYSETFPGKPPKVDVTMGGTALTEGEDYSYDSGSGSLNFKIEATGDIHVYGYYSIKFNTNGGSNVSSMTVKGGNSITMPTTTKSGINFEGWSTSKTSNTVSYKGGTSYQISDNLELYAVWTDKTAPVITITLNDYNTFKWVATDNEGVVGYAITTSSTEPTSWTTTGTLDMGVKDISTTESKTYYVWAKDQSGNIGKSTINNVKLTKSVGTGTTLTLRETDNNGAILTDDYVLKGTTIYVSGTLKEGYNNLVIKVNDTEKSNNSVQTVTSNTTVSATASLIAYTITYNLNGGTQASSGVPTTYKLGTAVTINGVPTKVGHTFKGWCVDAELKDCSTTQTISNTETGNKTYYAKWAANQYTITYNLNGGTNYTGAPTTYTYGEGATINGAASQDGKDFVAWCTDSALTSCSTTQTISTTATGNKTFYAKWLDIVKPTVTITRKDYNTFSWTAADDVSVAGYAITTSETEPTTWTTSGTLTSGTYDIDLTEGKVYYLWAKDSSGNIASTSIASYTVNKKADEGTTLTITEETTALTWNVTDSTNNVNTTCVLAGTKLKVSATADTGWTNLTIYNSFTERETSNKVTNNSEQTIDKTYSYESTAVYPYTISYVNINNSSTLISSINKYEDYSATLPVDSNSEHPYDVSIKMGGTVLTVNNYEYSNETGLLKINNVTGNLEITGVDQYYTVSYLNISNTSSLPTTVKRNAQFSTTITSIPQNVTVYMNEALLTSGTDYTYNNSTGAISITKKAIGNIEIYGFATVTYVNFEDSSTYPTTAILNENFELNIPEDSNEQYPESVKVYINSTETTNFTYDKSTGTLIVTSVTGDIKIENTSNYTISYVLNSGVNYSGAPTSYKYGTGTTISGTPKKTGYTFTGWCTGDDFTDCAMTHTISATDSGNKVFLAKWDEEALDVGDLICEELDGFTTTNDHTADGCPTGSFLLRVANTSDCTTETSQTACGTVIEFVDIITTYEFNSTATSVGGWPASAIRTYINDTIYNALSEDLRENIIDTTVVSSHGSSDSSNFTSTDKLYLLSPTEIYGTSDESDSFTSYDSSYATTRQLDYYNEEGVTTSNYSGAIKKLNGTAEYWWLRSATSFHADSFFSVVRGGDCFDSVATDTDVGVSPAFRVNSDAYLINYSVSYANFTNVPSVTKISSNSTYTATLADKPTGVTVKMGGTILTSSSYTYDSTTGLLTIPNVTGNLVITNPYHTYTATFNKGTGIETIGSTSLSCTTTETSCTVTAPTITSSTGYSTGKWGTSSTTQGSIAAGSTITLSSNTTYYAIAIPNTYTISYALNGGTQATSGVPTTYTYGTETTISGIPTKTDLDFEGWCTDSELTNCSMTQTISTTDYGNKTFYAKWETPYTVGDTMCVTLDGFATTNDHTAQGCTEGQFLLRLANTSTPTECSTEGFSQTACGTVLEFVDVITTHAMNSTPINVGGWASSEMRTYVNDIIYNALPTDIKSKIIDTTVVSSYGSSDSANFTSTDKLYLLSPTEIYGTSSTSNSFTSYDSSYATTRQLDFYNEEGVTTLNYSGAIKELNGEGDWWWLRSAISDFTIYFLGINSSGDWDRDFADSTLGVSPAFRVDSSAYLIAYNVSYTGFTNIPSVSTAISGKTFTVTLEDKPDSVAITMGGTALTSSSYTYNSSTGVLTINNVTGDITITA